MKGEGEGRRGYSDGGSLTTSCGDDEELLVLVSTHSFSSPLSFLFFFFLSCMVDTNSVYSADYLQPMHISPQLGSRTAKLTHDLAIF